MKSDDDNDEGIFLDVGYQKSNDPVKQELLDAAERMHEAILKTKLPVSQIPEIAYAAQFLRMAIAKAKGEL